MGFERGAYGPVTRDEIASAWAGQLTSLLRARFLTSQDAAQKASIAATLVELGDNDDSYWNYLVDYARPALDSDSPDWSSVNGRGGIDNQSDASQAWAKAHNVTDGSAAEAELRALPMRIQILASTFDPRAIPLLRRALQSPSYEIELAAVSGLDSMQDRKSIPLIIEACKRAPAATARQMASYLNEFDDPSAKAAAKLYMEKQRDPVAELTGDDPAASGSSLESIANAHRVDAIPELEKRFQEAPDSFDPASQDTVLAYVDKAHIANVLVRLGDSNPAYWDYLVSKATLAVESSAPPLQSFDAEGHMVPGPSPQFEAWAKSQGKSVDAAVVEAMIVDFSGIEFLAQTHDPRGLPLLRRALQSANYMVQGAAARELADRQDAESIPLLIAACRTAPREIASSLASDLARFDDPAALAAAAEYMPKAMVTTLHEEAHKHSAAAKTN